MTRQAETMPLWLKLLKCRLLVVVKAIATVLMRSLVIAHRIVFRIGKYPIGDYRFMATVVTDGKRVRKYFSSPEAAHKEYIRLKKKLHGKFAGY